MNKCVKRITQLEKYISFKGLKIPDELDTNFDKYKEEDEEGEKPSINFKSVDSFEDLIQEFRKTIKITEEQENELNEFVNNFIKANDKTELETENKKLSLKLEETKNQITELSEELRKKVNQFRF